MGTLRISCKGPQPGLEGLQRLRAWQEKALELLCHVYSFFTATLRHFYGAFMTACSTPGILIGEATA